MIMSLTFMSTEGRYNYWSRTLCGLPNMYIFFVLIFLLLLAQSFISGFILTGSGPRERKKRIQIRYSRRTRSGAFKKKRTQIE